MQGCGLLAMSRRDRQVALGCIGLVLLLVGMTSAWSGGAGPSDQPIRESDARTVTDVDGNEYRTSRIGTQVWMAGNLRVTHYRDGTAIPQLSGSEAWSKAGAGAYCLPESDPAVNDGAYGLLYNFGAVSDSCLLCPEGWHVPTAAEWRTLIDHLGGEGVAGGKMKDTVAGLWRVRVRGTTNESGFSALPAGGRGRSGIASDVGYFATWWSSTAFDSAYAWHWGLYPDKSGIRSNPGHKSSGFSVRCIKD